MTDFAKNSNTSPELLNCAVNMFFPTKIRVYQSETSLWQTEARKLENFISIVGDCSDCRDIFQFLDKSPVKSLIICKYTYWKVSWRAPLIWSMEYTQHESPQEGVSFVFHRE